MNFKEWQKEMTYCFEKINELDYYIKCAKEKAISINDWMLHMKTVSIPFDSLVGKEDIKNYIIKTLEIERDCYANKISELKEVNYSVEE